MSRHTVNASKKRALAAENCDAGSAAAEYAKGLASFISVLRTIKGAAASHIAAYIS